MITKDLEHMRPMTGDEQMPRDSEYLGATDLDSKIEPVLTIKNLYFGKVTLSRGKETKGVLTFVEEKAPGIIGEVRPMILNAGNRQMLKKLYKQVSHNAVAGKKIQLYLEHGVRNPSNGELVDGIRIRDFIPKDGAKAPAAPKCENCKKEITGIAGYTAEQIAATNKQRYGKCLCVECGKKRKEEMEAAKAAEQAAHSAAAAEPDEGEGNDVSAELLAGMK